MKISIITVCYNSENTIKHTIESIYSQRNVDIEYIIIDGNSTDNTVKIINECVKRDAILISEPDSGLYDAMNKGISMAKGDIVGILNSDDLYKDQFVLQDVVKLFELDNQLDIVYGNLEYVKKGNVRKVVRKWKSKQYNPNFFKFGNVPPHPTLFLKRYVYDKVGMFNLNFKLAADYEFMFRVFNINAFKSFYFSRSMILMRLGGKTNNSIGNVIKGNLEILNAWRINGYKVPILLIPFRIYKRISQFF